MLLIIFLFLLFPLSTFALPGEAIHKVPYVYQPPKNKQINNDGLKSCIGPEETTPDISSIEDLARNFGCNKINDMTSFCECTSRYKQEIETINSRGLAKKSTLSVSGIVNFSGVSKEALNSIVNAAKKNPDHMIKIKNKILAKMKLEGKDKEKESFLLDKLFCEISNAKNIKYAKNALWAKVLINQILQIKKPEDPSKLENYYNTIGNLINKLEIIGKNNPKLKLDKYIISALEKGKFTEANSKSVKELFVLIGKQSYFSKKLKKRMLRESTQQFILDRLLEKKLPGLDQKGLEIAQKAAVMALGETSLSNFERPITMHVTSSGHRRNEDVVKRMALTLGQLITKDKDLKDSILRKSKFGNIEDRKWFLQALSYSSDKSVVEELKANLIKLGKRDHQSSDVKDAIKYIKQGLARNGIPIPPNNEEGNPTNFFQEEMNRLSKDGKATSLEKVKIVRDLRQWKNLEANDIKELLKDKASEGLAIDGLVNALETGSRWSTTEQTAKLRESLVIMSNDGDEKIRDNATKVLLQIGDSETMAKVRQRLKEEVPKPGDKPSKNYELLKNARAETRKEDDLNDNTAKIYVEKNDVKVSDNDTFIVANKTKEIALKQFNNSEKGKRLNALQRSLDPSFNENIFSPTDFEDRKDRLIAYGFNQSIQAPVPTFKTAGSATTTSTSTSNSSPSPPSAKNLSSTLRPANARIVNSTNNKAISNAFVNKPGPPPPLPENLNFNRPPTSSFNQSDQVLKELQQEKSRLNQLINLENNKITGLRDSTPESSAPVRNRGPQNTAPIPPPSSTSRFSGGLETATSTGVQKANRSSTIKSGAVSGNLANTISGERGALSLNRSNEGQGSRSTASVESEPSPQEEASSSDFKFELSLTPISNDSISDQIKSREEVISVGSDFLSLSPSEQNRILEEKGIQSAKKTIWVETPDGKLIKVGRKATSPTPRPVVKKTPSPKQKPKSKPIQVPPKVVKEKVKESKNRISSLYQRLKHLLEKERDLKMDH